MPKKRLNLDCDKLDLVPNKIGDCTCPPFGDLYRKRFQNLTFAECFQVKAECPSYIPYSDTFNGSDDQIQIVLGRSSVLKDYGMYNPCCPTLERLIALNTKEWTLFENNCFIDCIASWVTTESPRWYRLPGYELYFPIRMYVEDWISDREPQKRHIEQTTVSARELCMLLTVYKFRFFRPKVGYWGRVDRSVLFVRGPYVADFESTRTFRNRFKRISYNELAQKKKS